MMQEDVWHKGATELNNKEIANITKSTGRSEYNMNTNSDNNANCNLNSGLNNSLNAVIHKLSCSQI